MKLTDLNIDGIGVCRNVNFSRLTNGLNLIYGENGSGKSTVRRFMRGVLYGYDQPFWTNFINQHNQNIGGAYGQRGGQLGVANSQSAFQVSRAVQRNSPLEIVGRDGSQTRTPNGLNSLMSNLPAATYDAFFDIAASGTKPFPSPA